MARYLDGFSIYSFAFIFPKLCIFFAKFMKICRFSVSYKSFTLFSSILSSYPKINPEGANNDSSDNNNNNDNNNGTGDDDDNNHNNNNNQNIMRTKHAKSVEMTEKEYNNHNHNNNRENIIHYPYLSTPLSITEMQKLITMTSEFEFVRNYIDFMVKVEDQSVRMRLFDTLKDFLLIFSVPSRLLFLSTLIVSIPYSTLRSQFIYILKDLILSLRSLYLKCTGDSIKLLPLLSYLFSSGKIVDIIFSIKLETSQITSSNSTEALFSFLNFIRFFLLVEKSQTSVIGIWNRVEMLLSDIISPYQLTLEKFKFQNMNLMDNSREQDSQLVSMNSLGFGSLSKLQLQQSTLSQLNDSLLALDLISRINEIISDHQNSSNNKPST
jgi:hypothetical protein